MSSAAQETSRLDSDPARRTTALPPVVLMDGDANALSAARSLGRRGIRVYILAEPDACVRHSRYGRPIVLPDHSPFAEACARFLLSPDSDYLAGAILLAFSDSAIQLLCRHRDQLLGKYKLDLSDPTAQMTMLNKLGTYRAAVAAGVATPGFWVAESRAEVLALREQLVFPLIVKPLLAHQAKRHFGEKHKHVDSFPELLEVLDAEHAAGIDVLMMELIPGPDDLLCSYFTYLDEAGQPLFDFTKRVIRRCPPGMGIGCYHITDWVPEIIEPSRKLCRHVGLRGLANVEFKLDPRDGQYKLMECNARFVGSNGLLATAGIDLAGLVYNRLAGLLPPPVGEFKRGLRLWDPALDLLSFLKLRRQGQLTFAQWIASLWHRQTFFYFAWSDPLPALARGWKLLKLLFKRGGKSASTVAFRPATPQLPTTEPNPV